MNVKRIIAIIVFIAGVVLMIVSSNIKKQIAAGTLQIKQGEKSVSQANSLFSLSPATKQMAQGSINNANKKIAAGKQEIAYYTKVANELEIGGFVLMGAGILIFILGRSHKETKKKR